MTRWIWQSADYDYPVERTSTQYFDAVSGRIYCQVIFEGQPGYVPLDELAMIEDDDE